MSTGLPMFGNQIRQPRSPFAPAQPIQSPFQIPAFQNPAPGIPRPQEPQLPEYEFTEQPKEEQQSIIRSIADTGISGLQKGANLLSTPGDVIRNLIAGKPLGESFAPLLSPTSSENRTTGRDILRQQGLIGDEDTWGNFLAGVATEIVTDPLTLLTGGLSKGGQLAARAKALDTAKFAAAKKLNKEVGRVGPRQARSITTLRELIDEAPKEQADTLRAMLSKYSPKRQEKILNQTLGGPLAFALPGMMPIVPKLGKAGEAYTQGMDAIMRNIQFGKPFGKKQIDTDGMQKLAEKEISGEFRYSRSPNIDPAREEDLLKSAKPRLMARPGSLPESMPQSIRDEIFSWNVVSESPYSFSYYDITNKGWSNDPSSFKRVSDHWNFTSGGKQHARTDIAVPQNSWAIGEMQPDGTYKITSIEPKLDPRSDEYLRNARLREDSIAANKSDRSAILSIQAELISRLHGSTISETPSLPMSGPNKSISQLSRSKSLQRKGQLISEMLPSHAIVKRSRDGQKYVYAISNESSAISIDVLEEAYKNFKKTENDYYSSLTSQVKAESRYSKLPDQEPFISRYSPATPEEHKAFKKASSSRSISRNPYLAVAAVRMKNGEITAGEYADFIDLTDPFIAKGPDPVPTNEKIYKYMSRTAGASPASEKGRHKLSKIGSPIQDGQLVEFRIDIPTYNESASSGDAVYSITAHSPTSVTSKKVGEPISHLGIAKVVNPEFITRTISGLGNAIQIAMGSAKFPLATVRGNYVKIDDLPGDISNPNIWTEAGYNPIRSSYFVDVRSKDAVVGGSEAIMVGSRVFVKDAILEQRPRGVTFGERYSLPDPAYSASGISADAVSRRLDELGFGKSSLVSVIRNPEAKFEGRTIIRDGKVVRIELNASYLPDNASIDRVLNHEFAEAANSDGSLNKLVSGLTDSEKTQINETISRLGYTGIAITTEEAARAIETLASAWKGRPFFSAVLARVQAIASSIGFKLSRGAAEYIAARSIAKINKQFERGYGSLIFNASSSRTAQAPVYSGIAPVNDFLNLFSKRSNETRSPTGRAYARRAFEDQQAGRYGAKMEAYDVMDKLKGTEFVTEEGQEKLRELLTAKTEIGLMPLDFQKAAVPLMRAGFVKDKATDIQKLFSDPNFLATQDQEVVDAVDNLITNFGVNNADEVQRLQGLMELKSPLERQPQKIQEALGVLKGAGPRMLDTARHYGIPMTYLNDMYADYFARQKSGGKVKGATQTTAFAANDFGQKARLDFFRDIPGAEKTLNEVLSDEDIWQLIDSSADSDTIAEALRAKFGNIVPDRYTTLEERRRIEAINKEIDIKNAKISKQNQERVAKGQEPKPLIPRKTPKTKDRFKALGKFMENQAREDLANGIFTNSPFADFIVRRSVASDYEKQLENAVRLLAEPGVIQNTYVRGQNQPLLKMIAKLRLKPGQLVTDEAGDLLPLEDMDGFLPRIAEELERRGIAQASDIDPKGMFVRNDIAEDILRFIKPFTAPESTTRWYELYDSAMNFHKAMLTGVRPAFHVRNLMSATLKNALRNMIDVQSLKDTWDLMRGKTVRNASKIPKVREYWTEMGNSLDQLDDQKATEVLGRMLAASGQGPRLGGELANKIGATVDPDPGSISEILGGVTGRGNKVLSFREFARKVAGMSDDSSWKVKDWLNIDKLAPVTSGKYLGGAIEAFARTSPMIYLMRQGYDPVVAARRVAEAQVDYGSRNYTKLELQRMTRLFPFYKFTRGTIPEELRYLAQNPGGLQSQLIRQSGRTSENDELTPDYVAESVSIPTTGTPLDYGKPAGTDRYVTGFGFAFEDPFAFLSGGGRGAIGETISRMNPLVKGAIEWGSGESFFQRTPTGGRELADQDPNIGRLMANLTGLEKPVRFAYQEPIEFLAANSPISPFLTIARQLTDTRKNSLAKAANLLTGIKVTDVSPAVKDQLLRGFVEQQMVKRGAKQFLRTYYPKEELAALSPDEQMEILQLQSIANMLAEETKKRKALKEQEKQRANLMKSQSME